MEAADSSRSDTSPPALSLGAGGGGLGRCAASVGFARAAQAEVLAAGQQGRPRGCDGAVQHDDDGPQAVVRMVEGVAGEILEPVVGEHGCIVQQL
jgi:hypothetical protein